VLRDAAAAEDVCQQAFLKAWQCQSAIRDRSGLSAWLAKVVVNESLQVLRRRKTELAALETAALFRAPQQSLPGDPLENRDHVLLALEKLPEITRLVVAMRLMQGLSGNEVKELLGCSAAEVSRQLHCGIER
jgi:RNA polymerase sigma-70 factor (ECF subfamily)